MSIFKDINKVTEKTMNQNLKALLKKTLIWVIISTFIILLLLGIIASGFAAYYTGKLDLINSMGTLLLALATIYIVYEMKKARGQNIEPTLFILEPVYKRYEYRWIPLEDLSPSTKPELKKDEVDRYDSRLPVFRLKNIGTGPAKDIDLTWSIKTDLSGLLSVEALQKYHPKIENNTFSLQLNNQSVRKDYLHLMQMHVDYCIASPSSDFIETVEIPIKVFTAYEFFLLTLPRFDKISVIQCPDIHLVITFLDLHNKKYEKELVITSDFTFLPNEASSQTNVVSQEFWHDDNLRGYITFWVKEKN